MGFQPRGIGQESVADSTKPSVQTWPQAQVALAAAPLVALIADDLCQHLRRRRGGLVPLVTDDVSRRCRVLQVDLDQTELVEPFGIVVRDDPAEILFGNGI